MEAYRGGAPARRVLSAATILAHNLGDLSRVVEAWAGKADIADIRARYTRLGHPDSAARRPAFVTAGLLNKALMALENHRFLFLRKPRALRTSRALLLPIGPWFDAWGETIARSATRGRDRAEIVARSSISDGVARAARVPARAGGHPSRHARRPRRSRCFTVGGPAAEDDKSVREREGLASSRTTTGEQLSTSANDAAQLDACSATWAPPRRAAQDDC